MKITIPIEGIHGEIHDKYILIESDKPLKTISSAFFNGGMNDVKYIINHYVETDYNHKNPVEYLKNIINKLNIEEKLTVGFLTSVKMENASWKSSVTDNFILTVIATAGINNPQTVGLERPIMDKFPGTVNLFVFFDGNLEISAHINALNIITEAKVSALIDLDVRGRNDSFVATGTTTDSCLLACTNKGKPIKYSGTATLVGEELGKLVKEVVKDAIKKNHNIESHRSLELRLQERKISVNDLIEGILELYVPHPGIETRDEAKKWLETKLKLILLDPNISALVEAGLRLEEDGIKGLIPMISAEEFLKDPRFLVADEILGMAIADYIAGSRGTIEFVRFDKKKPGILKTKGPILDDILGGLMAGVSSLMYSDSIFKSQTN